MPEHLTGNVLEADYLVDLSNVVRRPGPRGPGLYRLDQVIDALIDRDHDPDVVLYLVADRSLPHAGLPHADTRTLRDWEQAGLVELLGDADVRLLELAELTGLSVITRDRYRGHRTEFPWLQGNKDQFIEPFIERDEHEGHHGNQGPDGPEGRLLLRDVDMGVVDDWNISRYAEHDVLKKQGVLTRFDVLERAWRCPHHACTLYDRDHGSFVLIPRIRAGEPTCELHGSRLLDEGPRPGAAAMKVLVDRRCVDRFVIPSGTEVVVGRAPVDGYSLDPWLANHERLKVSRRHFALSFADGNLTIRDVSTYGTHLQLAPGAPLTVLRGTERILGVGEKVRCTRRITLTRSGRRFPNELRTKRAQLTTEDHEATQ
ncbi:hypothetical protein ACG83_20685 [Frankia sp. R43]|uniref:hypothetical protein n=1 Tax=Frankia sp. R43 TaxID=269536 RepID=UPI0006C9EAC3|nr:hypothetical protein [Frankia sp. R43]KPM54355.1 hypothetical protein ACG83_20685 [Frankia sp. R43]